MDASQYRSSRRIQFEPYSLAYGTHRWQNVSIQLPAKSLYEMTAQRIRGDWIVPRSLNGKGDDVFIDIGGDEHTARRCYCVVHVGWYDDSQIQSQCDPLIQTNCCIRARDLDPQLLIAQRGYLAQAE